MKNLMHSSRRELISAAGAIGGLGALQGIGAVSTLMFSGNVQAASMSLSTLRSTSKSWLWAIEDFAGGKDFFTKAGLTVAKAATERGTNHDALLGGASDVLLGAPQQNMRVQILGKPVVIIAGMVNKFASNVVIKKSIADRLGVTESSPIEKKRAALKGLRMGTTGPGGAPDQLLRHFLRQAGLDPNKDAKLVPIRGGAAMIAGMQQDQIDGFCLSSPTSDLAVEKAGATYLFNMAVNPPKEFDDYLYITASVTEETAKAKPQALTAYCKGLALALKAQKEDPALFKLWARSWFSTMDDALFETAYKNNSGIYMSTPVPSQHHFDVNLKFMNQSLIDAGREPAPKDYSYEKAFNLTFAKQALA